MATGVHNYDATAANNTTIQKDGGGTHAISDSMATDTIDNVKRQIMADLANFLNWPVKTTAYTAVAYDAIQADTVTTSAFTITLPASPSAGHWVQVLAASTWATNNLTIGRGGSTIRGNGSDLVLSDDIGAMYVFYYDGSTWQYSTTSTSLTGILKEAKGADIASATALTLGSDGNFFDVTGTTAITSINTVGVGTRVTLQFDAALTLTHHATDLILPGGANITTAAGDVAVFREYAAGDWICVSYTNAGASPVLGSIAQLDEATAAQFQANTADKALSTDQTWSAADYETLTDAATISVDMGTFINATVTLGGNRTLGNPTNTKNGQTGVIEVVQDGTGSRTLSFGSNYKFAGGSAPTLTTTASAKDYLFYQVVSSTFILITSTLDVS